MREAADRQRVNIDNPQIELRALTTVYHYAGWRRRGQRSRAGLRSG